MKLLPVVGENYEVRNHFLKLSLDENDCIFAKPEVLFYSAKVTVEPFPVRGIPLFRCYGEGHLTLVSPLLKVLPFQLTGEEVFISKDFMAFKKNDALPFTKEFTVGKLKAGNFEYLLLKGEGILFLSSYGFVEITSLNGEKRVRKDDLLLWKGNLKLEPLEESELSLKGEGIVVTHSVEKALSVKEFGDE